MDFDRLNGLTVRILGASLVKLTSRGYEDAMEEESSNGEERSHRSSEDDEEDDSSSDSSRADDAPERDDESSADEEAELPGRQVPMVPTKAEARGRPFLFSKHANFKSSRKPTRKRRFKFSSAKLR